MRSKRGILGIFVGIIAIVASQLSMMPAAQAASLWDDAITTVNSFVVTNPTYGCRMDLTGSWLSAYESTTDTASVASLQSAMTNGGSWGVEVFDSGSGSRDLRIYWTETGHIQIDFDYLNDEPTALVNWSSGSTLYFANIWLKNNCQIGASGQDYSMYGVTATADVGFFKNALINYPSGYEGNLVPNEPPAVKYVAMGDSFSSGEGNSPFESGSDNSADQCHRSSDAYPRLLAADSSLNLDSMLFVACSGATTDEVLDGRYTELPQTDALSADNQVVTITIGGNDVGFGDYAEQCVVTLCGPTTTPYTNIMNAINDPDFHDSLVQVYETVIAMAPIAHVYVLGYPYLAAEDAQCGGAVDLSGAYYVEEALNSVIEDAVSDVASSRLSYVDPNLTGSPFENHYLCDNVGGSDFNGVVSPTVGSFHPNAAGHQDYAGLIKGVMP